ncbi:MAG: hypothetical protein GDA48_05180 [Hormoscilla sp. GM102CHS1]|nr:hypothetical protein [Hormoscilla sp. GM102CHS1]
MIKFNTLFYSINPNTGGQNYIGEIDIEVAEAIIEVTNQPRKKAGQIGKLITNPNMNPTGKQVILYAPNFTVGAGEAVIRVGGVMVRTQLELNRELHQIRSNSMLKTIVLVSSVTIVKSEFMQFIQTLDNYSEDPDKIYDGQLDNNNGYFWVRYDPEEEFSGSELEAKIENIIPKLGSSPQTEILLDIGKNVQSEMLAAEFVKHFDKIWPCVVDTLSTVYSVPEFLELYSPQKSRTGDPAG